MFISVKMVSDYLFSIGLDNLVEGNSEEEIIGFSSIFNYKPGTMTFIVPERKVSDYFSSVKCNTIPLIIMSHEELSYDKFQAIIRVGDPRKAFFKVIEHFFDISSNEDITGISSNPDSYKKHSYISNNAIIGKNVKIGIGCIIEGDVVIGDNTEIHHNVVVRNKTKIGSNCTIFSGTIIGERGFNVFRYSDGTKEMIKHYGGVVIEDNVHIGDSCCISRGTIDDTVIKKGVKMNKSAIIAHNVIIGENTIITTPVFICGSVSIGMNCHIAASIIRNQVSIGDNAILGLGSVVVNNIKAGDTVIGNPAKPINK